MSFVKVSIFVSLLAIGHAYAGDEGSSTYCSQLAEIGANAYQTKQAGYSMGEVLQKIGDGLRSDAQKKTAAQGVVVAVYGDASIRSASQAYGIVYNACKR